MYEMEMKGRPLAHVAVIGSFMTEIKCACLPCIGKEVKKKRNVTEGLLCRIHEEKTKGGSWTEKLLG